VNNVELTLTLAGALITVWLSLLVAGLIWLARRALSRARREIGVLAQALQIRTTQSLVDSLGALGRLGWLLAAVLIATPFLVVTVGPLLLAIAGLDVHMVRVEP
jgi:hypothetical protein